MRVLILFFLFFFKFSSINGEIIGEWEYFGKNNQNDNFYFNTYAIKQDLYNLIDVERADGFRSHLLIEFSEYQNNGQHRYNYIVYLYDVYCHNFHYKFDTAFYFNKNGKPYFYNSSIDKKIFYIPNVPKNYQHPGSFSTYFDKICSEFYGIGAKFKMYDGDLMHSDKFEEDLDRLRNLRND